MASEKLGVSGSCDVVEFHTVEEGIALTGRDGTWKPYPIEYKRGISKGNDADRLQLCCQALCLEEMLSCEILDGAIYYNQSRRREQVHFTPELRNSVISMLNEMHSLYQRSHTPKVKTGAFCKACSLNAICVPKLCKKTSAVAYLSQRLSEV